MPLPEGLLLEISVDDRRWQKKLPDYNELVTSCLKEIINNVPQGEALKSFSHIELSVVLCDNALIRELNSDYRTQDKPTNVLSFPGLDAEQISNHLNGETRVIEIPHSLGEIYIAFEIMSDEAVDASISLKDHFQHLTLHGILHLLGFDHIENDEAEIMEALETKLLENLGIDDPYSA